MELREFYDLKINQTIWFNGNKYFITLLDRCDYCNELVKLETSSIKTCENWENIHKNCSLTEPKKEEWIKFYKVFDIEDGQYFLCGYTKEKKVIKEYFLEDTCLNHSILKVTNKLIFEALINEHGKVLKYRFPSNEIMEV
jgi:hypothetical protein